MEEFRLMGGYLAYIPFLTDAVGFYHIDFQLPGNYDKLVTGLLGILVLAGLIYNPTTENKGFGDDKNV
ncbi:hypothetical protein AA0X95_04295 [Bacillus sp. 1P10SD]|uniref:hypothetical protein n=1 Tax=Bacillus sp. 1P10SD TaxID=3132265 RepID=UPI0039A78278